MVADGSIPAFSGWEISPYGSLAKPDQSTEEDAQGVGATMNTSAIREGSDMEMFQEGLHNERKRSEAIAQVMALKTGQNYSERLSAISHFTMEIAHHLNNTLTPIICYAQMLSQGSCSPIQEKRLRKITEAAYRAKEIIDGLMSFAGGQPTHVLPIDFKAVTEETIHVAEGMLWLPSRQVEFHAAPGSTTILGDPHQISQAILHLLKNAMQATTDGTRRIQVCIEHEDKAKVALSVRDNGCGIPPEILPKVLLPFFTTREGEGVGLGLSIVNGIAEAHEAEMEISTDIGKGTCVRMVFPAFEEPFPQPPERNHEPLQVVES